MSKRASYTEWQAMSSEQRSQFMRDNPRAALGFLNVKVAGLQEQANQQLHKYDTQGEGGTES